METKTRRSTIALCVVYLVLIVWIILFKMADLSEVANLDRIRSINLIPFYYDVERTYHLSEVLQNIVIFIPFGVYLKMLSVSTAKAILCGAGISLSLETLQFALGIGATDITDLLMNTVGTAAGVGAYCLLSFVFTNRKKLDQALNIAALLCTALWIAFVFIILSFH